MPGQPDVEELVRFIQDERAGFHQVSATATRRRDAGQRSVRGRRRRASGAPPRARGVAASPGVAAGRGPRPPRGRAEAVAQELGLRSPRGTRRSRAARPRRLSSRRPRARTPSWRGFFLERGHDVLVEKPITASRAGGRRAGGAGARTRPRSSRSGHVERYNPAVEAALGARREPGLHRGPPARRSSRRAASTSTSCSTS